jgi:cation:H+ antiporter
MTLLLFLLGLVLLIGGAELLVRGASNLALQLGIAPLIVGLTVVAYGTSAPELAVSIQSSLAGQASIALGNVIGSNIANVLLILGLSALITPLVVSLQLIRFDVPLMIGVSLLLPLLAVDGTLGRIDGSILFLGAIIYTIWLIRQSRKEKQQAQEILTDQWAGEQTEQATPSHPLAWVQNIALLLVGLGLLVLGSNWLIAGAVTFARWLNVSELIIGLTIVAVGTSLPEIATSVVASLRGQRDIAVGNVVGSNIFNILSVLGLTSIIAPDGIPIPSTVLQFDVPIMVAVAVACLPVFFTGSVIARWEGGLFFAYYIAYTLYLILRTTQPVLLPLFQQAMFFFALPLTAITLLVLTIHAVRRKRGS